MPKGDFFVTTTSGLMVIREADAPLTRGVDQGDEEVALSVLRAAASSTSAVTLVIPNVLRRVADADWWGFVERREDFWRCAEFTLSKKLHTGAEHFVPLRGPGVMLHLSLELCLKGSLVGRGLTPEALKLARLGRFGGSPGRSH